MRVIYMSMQMAGLNVDGQRAIVDALNSLHAVELSEKSRGRSLRGT